MAALMLCWAANLAAAWVCRRWLGGEKQGYVMFSILVSCMYTALVLTEAVSKGIA